MLAGDIANTGLPTGIKVILKAKLCLRMANVGFLPETNLEKLDELTKSVKTVVLEPRAGIIQRGTGDKCKPALKSTAKLMSDCDSELASVLLTRKPNTIGQSNKMKRENIDNIRKR